MSLLAFVSFVSFVVLLRIKGAQASPDLSGYAWLYLRGGEPVGEDERPVELIAGGDVMLARGVAGEPDPLAEVTPWLKTADVAMANLECAVGDEGSRQPGPYRLQAPPAAAGTLRRAGLDIVGLANNHALDYGPEGLAETVDRLSDAGIAPVGVVAPDAAGEIVAPPTIRTVRGVRLAFLAFNVVPDPDAQAGDGGWAVAGWDEERAIASVAAAREQADAVIVAMHWGYEYETAPDPAQRSAAHALLDAGADLVIGHHPHVVQGTEVRGGRFVAYSLGNLVFDQEQGDTRRGLILRALFDREGLRAVQALPLWAGRRPRPMTPAEAAALLSRVQPPAPRLRFACTGRPEFSCRAAEAPEGSGGVFRAGEIDLTGDGRPEQVQLLREQVVVYDGGHEAWRGLPEWSVADLALGDPNDDGRSEMVLALWKNDPDGVAGSHPFVVGYREGAYRVLWGGSAVADPIREVELADLDGDGVQELVVLEDSAGKPGQVSLAVWRWHGWGFGLKWRSAPGRYADLAVDVDPGGAATVSVAVRP